MTKPRGKPCWRQCLLPPLPVEDHELPLWAEKGYDFADVRSAIGLLGYVDHIKSGGGEYHASQAQPG